MSLIEVAIPMRRGRRRFHVEKGRRWSVIEHLMLEAVSQAPATTAELSKRSKLHRRTVVEAFIRLMRAGWSRLSTIRARRYSGRRSRARSSRGAAGTDDDQA
jgi:cardiolipin synthase